MTPTRKLVTRLEHPHRIHCHARAKKAGCPSPWWIHSLEYRSSTGRKHQHMHMHTQFLRLQCLFHECKAVLLVESLGAGDILSKLAFRRKA